MITIILAKKILSLYLILLMGIILVRARLLKSEDSKTLSIIMLYVILPCVVIKSFQIDYTPEVRDGLILAVLAAVLIHVILLVSSAVLGRLLRWDPVEKCSIIYSNAGNLIVPIVTSVLGPEYVIYTCAFCCVQTFLLWSHAKMLLCGEKSIDFKKILKNVNMICILIGITLFLLGIRLPAIVADSFDTVGAMIGPASMLVTGMLVGSMDLRRLLSFRRLPMVMAFRLIIYPAVLILIMKNLGLASMAADGQMILLVCMLATTTPAASTITQMAQIYDGDADYASAINVATTLLCVVTMPLMVMLYQM